jgi:hypothetical protein
MFVESITLDVDVLYQVVRNPCGVNCVLTFDWK